MGSIPITRFHDGALGDGAECKNRFFFISPHSSAVEHFLGKEEVTGSIPVVGYFKKIVDASPVL